jgi:hypothetical protein
VINFIRDIKTKCETVAPVAYDTNKPDNSTATQYIIFSGVTVDNVKTRRDFMITFDLFDRSDSFINIYNWMDDLATQFNYQNICTDYTSYHSYEDTRYTVPSRIEDDKTWKHGVMRFLFKAYLK